MIHKGEIYLTDRYRGGKKDYGRPVLILSSAENNRETGCVVAAPLVSRERYAAASHIAVESVQGQTYVAVLEHVKSLPERSLQRRKDHLSHGPGRGNPLPPVGALSHVGDHRKAAAHSVQCRESQRDAGGDCL